nr:MAG TPA: Minor capsid protein [Caudoviricetes sp.]
MGIGKNFFSRMFGKLNIDHSGPGYTIKVSYAAFGKRLDKAQDALDAQVWQDIQRYMPMDTASLIVETDTLNKSTRGEVYLYPPDSDYGHYQHEGEVYEDPVYGKGAFYDPEYGYWSRPGVKKVPSGKPLNYSRESAEAHWEEAAEKNHAKSWLAVARRAMKGD